MLDSELFKNKRVLDIGCNSGNITIMIGLHYHPSSIFGIDLDDGLIQKAEHQLRIVNSLHNPKGNDNTMDISMKYHYFPRALPSIHGVIPMTMPPNYKSTSFPYNVKFETNNWMEMDLIGHKHYYDTILALSITKWIHIHHGDDGLKDFFKKIYKALKHGGTMILEPQEYDTYERRAKLTDKTKLIFDTIQFKPEHFHDYLIKEVGFKEFKDLGYAEQHKEKGFQRPIHLYIK
ncbi:Bicoid-interacting protein 3-domain-containing protein [Circinella umbellata]|nr:Bicoid-interacting protein 3-domain-containing protein [Circinella umbellata]